MGLVLKTFLLTFVFVGAVWASGFNINEAGARATSLGNAVTARVTDASMMFYNPAGIGFLEGTNFYGSVTLIKPNASFVGAAPIFDNTIHSTQDKLFPPVGIHLTHRYNEKLAMGISLSNPFGLGVFWEDDFPGRFISREVDLKSYYVSPAVALRATNEISFSLGLDFVYSSVTLRRNILAFGSGGSPGTEVGEVDLSGNSNLTMGFTASMLYRGSRGGLGFFYRHDVENKFENADAIFTLYDQPTRALVESNIAGPNNEYGLAQTGGTSLNYPSYLSLGFQFMLTDKLDISADGALYRWDVFDQINLEFANPALNQTIPEDYHNSVQLRLGAQYALAENLDLRVGYIYDETPQPTESVSPLLPDDTRNDYAVGIGYTRGNTTIDLGYMFVNTGDRSTIEDGVGLNDNGFNGEYSANAHLVLLGFGYSFNK